MKFSAPLRVGENNLFDESMFKKSEATKFKKELASRMVKRIDDMQLAPREAAKTGECAQADIKRLRKGEIAGYGLEELIGLARKFDLRIKIAVELPKSTHPSVH